MPNASFDCLSETFVGVFVCIVRYAFNHNIRHAAVDAGKVYARALHIANLATEFNCKFIL